MLFDSQQLIKDLYAREKVILSNRKELQAGLRLYKAPSEQKLLELQQIKEVLQSREQEIASLKEKFEKCSKCVEEKLAQLTIEIENKNAQIHKLMESNSNLEGKQNEQFLYINLTVQNQQFSLKK